MTCGSLASYRYGQVGSQCAPPIPLRLPGPRRARLSAPHRPLVQDPHLRGACSLAKPIISTPLDRLRSRARSDSTANEACPLPLRWHTRLLAPLTGA